MEESKQEFRVAPEGWRLNHEGEPRHVGVEIEFAAVTAEAATHIVQSLFGGDIETIDAHMFRVTGTGLGDFLCELDFQYAHESAGSLPSSLTPHENFGAGIREAIGNISALLAPCEIACPPVEIGQLPRIEDLRQALREAGAHGTDENFFYAFGAQLNPEIVSTSPGYIVSVLKAYLLLSDWLWQEIDVDPARQLLAFAEPFPPAYRQAVLGGTYEPELETLIDDYLAYNPTRNRELDLLPLFAWLDERRVAETVENVLIKPRPTFHYRLPNAQLQDPDWSIAQEWNRWCHVEYLAADEEKLEQARNAWLANSGPLLGTPWAEEAARWLI